jgi:hypothetical protein
MAMSSTARSAVLQVRTPNGQITKLRSQETRAAGHYASPSITYSRIRQQPSGSSEPPGAPPFTGEDVEDVGRPRKRDRPPVM